jgi:hypothetical protein
VVDDGKLRSLDLATRPVRLASEGFAADLGAGAVRVRVSEGAADVRLELALAEASNGTAELEEAVIRLTGRAPYPDMESKRLDGPLRLNLGVRAASADAGGTALAAAELNLDLAGEVSGPWSRTAYAPKRASRTPGWSSRRAERRAGRPCARPFPPTARAAGPSVWRPRAGRSLASA